MADILPFLLSFPNPQPSDPPLSNTEYENAINSHIEALKGLPDESFLMEPSSGSDLFSVVKPTVHTVSYAFALLAHLRSKSGSASSTSSNASLMEATTSFLQNFDVKQIRYIGSELLELIEAAANYARQSRQPEFAVLPIRDALLNLDPSGSTFISPNLLLVRLAMESRLLAPVASVIQRPIIYFPGMSTQPLVGSPPRVECPMHQVLSLDPRFTRKIRYQDVLEYFLLSGTIQAALSDWEKAASTLENVITYPVRDSAISKLMVEAYKKWILVNLLLRGKVPGLPGTISTHVARYYHTLAKSYETVATLFESASANRLRAEVTVGQKIWQDDGNTGLMLQVLAAFQRVQISNLSKVYISIPITVVTRMTFSAETGLRLPSDQATESLISAMISDGSIDATLVRPAGASVVLSFNPTMSPLSEEEVQRQLAESIKRIKVVTAEIKHTDRRLTYTREYIRWFETQKRSAKSPTDEFESNWNPNGMDLVEDEDLMSGNL